MSLAEVCAACLMCHISLVNKTSVTCGSLVFYAQFLELHFHELEMNLEHIYLMINQ